MARLQFPSIWVIRRTAWSMLRPCKLARAAMFKKLQVIAVLLCFLSYANAGTASIGTVSARGDLRVDNYNVKGNATLFDGSVVETDQASADLRLAKGVEIRLSATSRGTLYSDHIVLQKGESELSSSTGYQVQAKGIHVVSLEPYSRGVVSMKAGNTVEVASLDGSLGVTNAQGVVLANILPGQTYSFAMQAPANAGNPQEFVGSGLVSFDNGTYYLTTDTGAKYILTCRDSHAFVGDKVIVEGTVQGTSGNGPTMLCIKSMDINGPTSMSSKTKWVIAGIAIAAGTGAGIAIGLQNQSVPPASR